MTMSTHKTLFGPQGGLVIGSEEHAEPIKKAMFPGLTSSHHIHHMGAKAVAFAEALGIFSFLVALLLMFAV